jgi:hypothetical protein
MFSNKGLSRNCTLLTAPRSVPVRVKPGAGAPSTAGRYAPIVPLDTKNCIHIRA